MFCFVCGVQVQVQSVRLVRLAEFHIAPRYHDCFFCPWPLRCRGVVCRYAVPPGTLQSTPWPTLATQRMVCQSGFLAQPFVGVTCGCGNREGSMVGGSRSPPKMVRVGKWRFRELIARQNRKNRQNSGTGGADLQVASWVQSIAALRCPALHIRQRSDSPHSIRYTQPRVGYDMVDVMTFAALCGSETDGIELDGIGGGGTTLEGWCSLWLVWSCGVVI